MADFTALKTAIQNAIKQNGNNAITGNLLQDILISMVSTLGDSAINGLSSSLSTETTNRQNADGTLQSAINTINTKLSDGYIYLGIATPTTNPSTTSGKVFYIATTAGTYTNFLNSSSQPLVLTQGINILKYNGTSWSVEQVWGVDDVPTAMSNNLIKSGGVQNELALGAVYDVSAKNPTAGPDNDGKWESLSALLSDANLNTLIPTSVRKGGMSIKYVCSSDNKYVQYFLPKDEWSASVADWEKVNLEEEVSQLEHKVKETYGDYVENPEWAKVVTDSEDKILYGVKTDGKFYFGDGCPPQVQEYIQNIIDGLSLDEYEDMVVFLSDYLGSDITLKVMIDGINVQIATKLDKEGLDPNALNSVQKVENSEYIQVITDSEDKILESITSEGVKQINLPIDTPSATIEHVKSPEYISVITDSEGKILSYRDSQGVMHEKVGIDSPTIDEINNRLNELNDFSDIIKCEQEKQSYLTGLSQKYDENTTDKPQYFFVLAHITDSHTCPDNLTRAIKMLESEDFSDIDVLIHTGDCGLDYKDVYENAHREIFSHYKGRKPVLFSMGNHDCSGVTNMENDTRQDIVKYWFNYLYNSSINGIVIGENDSYYYYDNDNYKIRIIILNDYDWLYEGMQREFATGGDGTSVMYTQRQINWLIDTLNSVPANYTVILAKHSFDNGITYDDSQWTSPYLRGITEDISRFHLMRKSDGKKGRIIEDIINAYIQKTSLYDEYTFDNPLITAQVEDITVNADFSSAHGTFAFICCGHMHRDGIASDSDYSFKHILCAGSDPITAGWDNIGRAKAGKCANLLNLYVIRTDLHKVFVIRIGADFTQEEIKKSYTSFSY